MAKRYTNYYFICEKNETRAKKIADANSFDTINYIENKFRDGSNQCEFQDFDQSKIEETDCAILYYFFKKPFDSNVFNLLRLLNYLKYHFSHVVLLTPFMPFLREHRHEFRTDSSFIFEDIKIITLDAHVAWKNIISLPPSEFIAHIKPTDLIVLPDVGARRYLGLCENDYVKAVKDRSSGITFIEQDKIEGRNCVILDDIVDTGYTLMRTIEQLKKAGAKEIKACITHYLAEDLFDRACVEVCFFKWGLDFLYIYDTVIGDKKIDCAQVFDFTKAFSNLKEIL